MSLYDGSPVLYDPSGQQRPPKDCVRLQKIKDLKVDDPVYLQGIDPSTYTEMFIRAVDWPAYASTKERGIGAFLKEEPEGVIGSIYFAESALSQVEFLS